MGSGVRVNNGDLHDICSPKTKLDILDVLPVELVEYFY